MPTVATNSKLQEALNEGYSYDEIRDFAISQHTEMMQQGSTREEADEYMRKTWGIKSHLAKQDADRAEWVASLFFEDQQAQDDEPEAQPKSQAPQLQQKNETPDLPDIDTLDISSQDVSFSDPNFILDFSKNSSETQNGAPKNGEKPKPRSVKPTSAFESLIAGWQYSSGGLLKRGELPLYSGAGDGIISQAMFGIGQMFGDAPAFVLGGAAGGAAGSAIPLVGTLAGAGAGALGTAAYIRSVLMDAYEHGEATSFSDLCARWGNGVLAFGNDASMALGMHAVDATVAKAAQSVFGRLMMQDIVSGASKSAQAINAAVSGAAGAAAAGTRFGAELTTMLGYESLVEQKLPTMQDVLNTSAGLMGMKYFGGGLALTKTAYAKYGIHPAQLHIIAKVNPAFWQRLLLDATRSAIQPLKSVWAVETVGQAKYGERNLRANESKYNESPWLYVSEVEAEEAVIKKIGEDKAYEHEHGTNPYRHAADEAKAAYEHQVEVNKGSKSKFQKTKKAYEDARKTYDESIRAELKEAGLVKDDNKLPVFDPNPNVNSIVGQAEEIRRAAKDFKLSDPRGPNKADRDWANKVNAIVEKYEKTSPDDPFDNRGRLRSDMLTAKEAHEAEQQKVKNLEQAWRDAEKQVPRVTSDTPYRALREINIKARGATMHLNGMADKNLHMLAERFFKTAEGKKHPLATQLRKKGVTAAQKAQIYYELFKNPTREFLNFLGSGEWTLAEIRALGGEAAQKALVGKKAGEVVRLFGSEMNLDVDPKAKYKVHWQGVYMENGYLPLSVHSTAPGELYSGADLMPVPTALRNIKKQIKKVPSGVAGLWLKLKNKAKHLEFDTLDRFAALNRGHGWDGKITESYLAATEVAPSAGKAERLIDEGMRDWNTNDLLPNRRSLGDVLHDPNISIEDLDAYLVADSGINDIQAGKSTLVDKEAALSLRESLRTDKAMKPYKDAVNAVRQFNKDLIDYMYAAGLITKQQATELHGVRDTLTLDRVVTSIGEANISRTALEDMAAALGLKPDAKMSYRDALNKWRDENPGVYKSPLNQLLFSTMMAVRSAHINKAKKEIAGEWGVTPENFSKDKDVGFMKGSSVPLQKIEWREHGKKKTAWVDPEIYASMSQLDASSRAISSFIVKWVLDKPASLLRAGTTLSPSFAIKNAFIDQFTLGMQSRTGAKPFADLIWALPEIILGKNGHGSELFNQWLADGGMSGSFAKYGRNELSTLIDATQKRNWQNTLKDTSPENLSRLGELANPFPGLARLAKQGAKETAKLPLRGAKKAHKLLSAVSETGEMLPRFVEYVRALEQGASRREAAYMSRTVTLDFARAGATIRGLNQIAAFLNAGIQGADRIMRTAATNPRAFMVHAVNYIVMPTIWLSMAEASMMLSAPNSAGADAARERPDWMRAAYWPVYFGDDYEYCVNIPKPHGMLQTLALPFEAWIHDMAKTGQIRDPFTAMKENGLTEALKNAFPNPLDFQATGLKLGAELVTNHQFFTDNAIISSKYMKLAPEERYKENTSGTSILIGRWLQTLSDDYNMPIPQALQSPLAIDHIIRGLGGQLANQVSQIIGDSLPIDRPNRKRDWTQNPFVKQFFFRMPSYNAKSFAEFNELAEKVNQRFDTYKHLASSPNEADQMRALKYLEQGPLFNMNGFKQAMGQLGQAIDGIYRDDRIPADEKGKAIDELIVQQLKIARDGIQLAKELQMEFDLYKKRK